MKVAVGSKNPVKVEAARLGMQQIFEGKVKGKVKSSLFMGGDALAVLACRPCTPPLIQI